MRHPTTPSDLGTASPTATKSPAETPVRRPWVAAVALVVGVAAWVGAIALAIGVMSFGERIDARLPFDSPLLAGFALAVAVALPFSLLTWMAWRGHPRADFATSVAGAVLIGWIILQVLVIRAYSPFQPLMFLIGVGLVLASPSGLGQAGRGVLLVVVGAVTAAVGIGLLPHLIKRGVAGMSLVAVATLLAGTTAIAFGVSWALRGRHAAVKIAGGALTVAVLAVAASVVSPAVAVTNSPATDVGATPADVGLEYETVTVTTSDGVDLAAWYVPGDNGAGVVVMHGAGSTRSAVLDQAAVLARGGYAVLLLDARGHGDSDGTAMDFGWYGDADIAAGTGHLATRPDIDADRIGVVGFSMGGEQAIGAAANDPLIAAVVAEGATGRFADDTSWLSDVYGWRGAVQERLNAMQDAVTRYLTDAPTPTALRVAVEQATDTRFLLITAGKVADEGHAAGHLRAAAPEGVDVWTVEGAGHTDGYDKTPDEWQRRVLDFLDATLT